MKLKIVNLLLKFLNKDKLSYECLITKQDIEKVLEYFLIEDYEVLFINKECPQIKCIIRFKGDFLPLFNQRFKLLNEYLSYYSSAFIIFEYELCYNVNK